MHKIIIADTSCLIVLVKINELDVLRKLFGEIVVTPEIASEFMHELPEWFSTQKSTM